jgi:hypothetical protein
MSMRIIVAASAAVVVAGAAFAIGVHAEGGSHLAFGVANDTSTRVLTSLSVSRASAGDWRALALDPGQVKPGESAATHVDGPNGQCDYDVRAKFVNGAMIEEDGVDLCDLDANTLVLGD